MLISSVTLGQSKHNDFNEVLRNGIIGYWPFSGNANDLTNNGNNGTVHGANLTTDRFGNESSAYSFDGVDDYISIENSTSFNLNSISISLWYYESSIPNKGSSQALLSKSTSSTNQIGYRIETSADGKNYFVLSQMGFIQAGSGYVTGPVTNLFMWTNLVIVKNESTVSIYKNGVLSGSNSNLTASVNNSNHLLFGALTDMNITCFFQGKLDDVVIWNRPLTEQEIHQVYAMEGDKYKKRKAFRKYELTKTTKEDTLLGSIEKVKQKQIKKLVKTLSNANSSEKQKKSWIHINQYFLFNYKANQSVDFSRDVYYFLNILEANEQLKNRFDHEIVLFKETANEHLNKNIIDNFKYMDPSIENLSYQWKRLNTINQYPWVKIINYGDEFNKLVYEPIFKYYFEVLKRTNNLEEQERLCDNLFNNFPGINTTDIHPIDLIITANGENSTGKLTLINHSYLNDYVNNTSEFDMLKNIYWWLAKNEDDISMDLLTDSITKEIITLKDGSPVGFVEVFKNNEIYYQLQFDDESSYGNVKFIRIYEGGHVRKETYFHFPSQGYTTYNSYSFQFKNDVNVTIKGINDTLNLALNLAKSNKQEFEKGLNLIQALKKYNFPDTLALYHQIDSTKKVIEELKLNDVLARVENLLVETDNLITKNRFQEAKEKLNEAENISSLLKSTEEEKNHDFKKSSGKKKGGSSVNEKISIYTRTIMEVGKKQSELQSKEINFIETNERNKIQQILMNGKKLQHEKSYPQAITLFEKTILEYQTKPYPEIQTMKDELVILNKLLKEDLEAKQRKIIENKKIEQMNELQFTSIGKVEISKNYLNVTEFTNGDKLELANSVEEFARKTMEKIPVYCYYNFDEEEFKDKGIYYNVYALHDPSGRTLFPESLRLPFQSEIAYVYSKVKSQKGEIIDFLFSPDQKTKFNGFNLLDYKNSTIEYTYGLNPHAEFSPSKISNPPYGLFGTTDPKHMFWILPDFEIKSGEMEQYPGFFDCDFQSKTSSNHFTYSICEIPRENNYWSDYDVIFSNHTNLEDLEANPLKKSDFKLVAAQVKLVKQRPLMNSGDWLPNSTSKRLANKYVLYQNGNKTEITNIFESKNSKEWFEYCDKELPACASYEFNSGNDKTHGLIYNKFVFENGNYPLVSGAKNLEIIDLSNAKYIIGGNSENFYKYLTEKVGIKNGARLIWNTKSQKPEFYNYALHGIYNQETDYFFLKEINLNQYRNDDNYSLVYFNVYKYLNELKLNFSKMSLYDDDKYGGFSLRYLKK